MNKIKVLVYSEYYLPGFKGGGPIKTVVNLIEKTSDEVDYCVVTGDRDLADKCPYSNVSIGQWNSIQNYSVFYTDSGLKGLGQLYKIMSNKDYDVVYLNSFFSVRFSLIPLFLAKFFKKPIVLGPRGEFSEGALNFKASKKKLYIQFYKFLGLMRSVVLQASSDFEFDDIKRVLGNNNKIFVAEDIGSQEYAKDLAVKDDAVIKLVFISRISPKKNLSYALAALKRINCPVIFDIYGPQEDAIYWSGCEAIIKVLPKHVVVNYKGLLNPSDVVETLSTYDLFFMPTIGENYGHVIAEALCAGLPVLIANTTPWCDLVNKGIGWDISLEAPEQFTLAIEKASGMSAENYQEYRQNVLSWAKTKFSQPEAVNANKAMFKLVVENK
jgi:glycosyltransferase involved in cell wall biosynthesis